jgi:hypothetical protein
MRRFIRGSLIIIISGYILFSFSCTPGSCFDETESYLKASLYDFTTYKLRAPDSLTIYGLNNDSLLYRKSKNVQRVLLPLNSSSNSSIFVIIINGINDTVEFRYNSYPHLISKECGYTFYHHLDSEPNPSYHIIKKILTNNETITNLNVENIRIYF